jgi:hypothetical protein
VWNWIECASIQIIPRDKLRHRASVGGKKRLQIDGYIPHDRQITQGFDAQLGPNSFDQRAAGEPFAAIDDHRARSAHANPAGESECQIRARSSLQREKGVQYARLISHDNAMGLEVSLFTALLG